MTVHVRMTVQFNYWLDQTGDAVRHIPRGWAGDLEDDVAAAAIAEGKAEPTRDLPAHVARLVTFYRLILEGHTAEAAEQHLAAAEAGIDPGAAANEQPPLEDQLATVQGVDVPEGNLEEDLANPHELTYERGPEQPTEQDGETSPVVPISRGRKPKGKK